jgi:hypothetical protein
MGQDDNRDDLISRVGTFFVLLGILLVVLFIMSDAVQKTRFNYFFFGGLFMVIGLYFKRITARPPKSSNRFEAIRKWQQRQRDARAKKEAAQKAKK